ncbi:MAG TPA: cytochrome c3 family protein, partial [Vicinamibacterales bacterium]|nr:cytochrome c3 family protein [Vicinamibacterales bacterium]
MAQIFHRSTNTISRLSIFGTLFIVAGLLWLIAQIHRSSWITDAQVAREQPIQFSHERHVAGNGIDCRYCHTSVEDSSFAGIPPTKTCLNCHGEIFANSPFLQPVRASFETNRPLEWTRVHDLPDFVHFDHSIHVSKGMGCTTCHGP